MSAEEDDAGSQGLQSVIDDILDQYRFHWQPEYRIKFKKEISGFKLCVGVAKPNLAPTRLRLTVKPGHLEEDQGRHPGWHPGRFFQKLLVMPRQNFFALYSRKMRWGFLRCQVVAGYFWDTRRPSLDYRLSTKWNENFSLSRKEEYQPTENLLLRAKWNMDLHFPDVEGHLGGGDNDVQVPVEVDYGNFEMNITQLDFVCDLDGFKDREKARRKDPKEPPGQAVAAWPSAGAPGPAPAPLPLAASSEAGALVESKSRVGLRWPWQS